MLDFILFYEMNDLKNLHMKCVLGSSVTGEDTLENKEEQPQARLEGSLLQNLNFSAFVVLLGSCESHVYPSSLHLLTNGLRPWLLFDFQKLI